MPERKGERQRTGHITRRTLLTLTAAAGLGFSGIADGPGWPDARFATEKALVSGVANFGRVNDRLYRGGQPTDAGFAALKEMGVGIVVSLTLETDATQAEARRVRALGMDYVNLPWSATREPAPEQVSEYLTLIRDHPQRTIFVHCWQGADRTGVMVAIYRIAVDHWTSAQAIDEMRAFGYWAIFKPHLQRFVARFAASRVP